MQYRNRTDFIDRERPNFTEQIVNICTSSKKRMVLTALTGWLLATTFAFFMGTLLLALVESLDTRRVINAVVLGGVFGLLVMVLLVVLKERRRHLREELRQIANLNHHVRNALQAIAYSTFAINDAQLISIVNESVARIETALKDVLPIIGERGTDGLFKAVTELISFGLVRHDSPEAMEEESVTTNQTQTGS